MPFLGVQSASATDTCGSVKLERTMKGEAWVMLEVAAAITTSGVLAWVASGATASADGVMPMPASTSTFSLTSSSCARRRVMSGRLVSSLTISSTLRPATVSPFCAIHRRAAASTWRPVVACWPVMGRIRPILNGAALGERQSAGGQQGREGGGPEQGSLVHESSPEERK